MKPPPISKGSLLKLQRISFDYMVHEANPVTGLVRDCAREESPASTTSTGLALTTFPIAVERGYLSREEARDCTLRILRFFWNSPQGPETDATGYKGFYYHFLDMETGRRTWQSELSTIDTTFLSAGMLVGARYFNQDSSEEQEIRHLAEELYRRVDWRWALAGGDCVTHGWTPEKGFLKHAWRGYCEALLLYVLGLASPTYPLPAESYAAWAASYHWKKLYDQEFLYAGPLFIHQSSHLWIDFHGIQDAFMREHGIDYAENSRRAAYVQQAYAIRNPRAYQGYGEWCWGITASDGPGPGGCKVNGIDREFYAYKARGVPFGPDDGTLAPWVVAASLPFAPEIVLPTLKNFQDMDLSGQGPYGFKATFNPTYPTDANKPHGWVSPYHYGLNQGPVVLMIENYESSLIWNLMRACPAVVAGLRKAGFAGGWL